VTRLSQHLADLSESRLNQEEIAKAQNKLLCLMADREGATEGLNDEFHDIMIYNNRPLYSSTLLHLAVWCSSRLGEASLVEQVLAKLQAEQVFTKAKYKYDKTGATENWVDAIHLAAGMGSVSAMQALIKYVESKQAMSPKEYVSMWSEIHHIDTMNPSVSLDSQNFNMPIHEATYLGNLDVVKCLLDNRADVASPNKDGMCPLHFLAQHGTSGFEDDDEVKDIVRGLLKAGASLEASIPSTHHIESFQNKQPFELAAADDSRFPKRLIGILAPCLQKRTPEQQSAGEFRFFSDVKFVGWHRQEAAKYIVEEFGSLFAKDSDELAHFRRAAQLKGMTDMMASILYLTPLAGVAMLDMLTVQPHVQDPPNHNIPTRASFWGLWSNPSLKCTYKPDTISADADFQVPAWKFNEKGAPQWHSEFLPKVNDHVRPDYVYHVDVSTILMPNLLDIDILMALTRIRNECWSVFSNRSVEGLISCLWNNLIERVWLITLFFHMLELLALMRCVVYDNDAAVPVLNGTSLTWVIFAAGGIRELLNASVFWHSFYKKWDGHRQNVESDRVMEDLWNPYSRYNAATLSSSLMLAVVTLKFALDIVSDVETTLNMVDALTLAFLVLLKCGTVTFKFSLVPVGRRIHVICAAIFGGAAKEMLYITLVIFASFSMVFVTLSRGQLSGWVAMSAYRGLMFGDGDGLNNLGMDLDPSEYRNNRGIITFVAIIGSAFFNIVILNLIVAVYSNEYGKLEEKTDLLFLHGRVRNCVWYLLACDILPWQGHKFNFAVQITAMTVAVLALLSHANGYGSPFLVASLVASSQVLLQATFIQCDWFSTEGVAASEEPHYLWICRRSDDDNGGDGTLNTNDILDDRLSELRENVDDKIGRVENKLENKISGIESHLKGMEGKLDKILQSLSQSG